MATALGDALARRPRNRKQMLGQDPQRIYKAEPGQSVKCKEDCEMH